MTFWRAHSLAVLTVAGALSSPWMTSSAVAGEKIQFSIAGLTSDRIQFSAPTAPVAAPSEVVEEKEPPRMEYQQEVTSADRLFLDDNVHAAASSGPELVIVTPATKKSKDDPWAFIDSLYQRDDASSNPYAAQDESDSPFGATRGVTNRWDFARPWDSNRDKDAERLSGSRPEDAARMNRSFDRYGSRDASGKEDSQTDEGWRSGSDYAKDKSTWGLSGGHQDVPTYQQTLDAQFLPSYQQAMAANKVLSGPGVEGMPNDPMQKPYGSEPTRAPSTPGANSATQDQSAAAGIASYNPYTYPTTSSGKQNSAALMRKDWNLQTGQNQASPPPAILLFPKRPGDLFQ